MSKTLVIVESPTKAKKISEYLGNDVVVEASMGHIRDLPRSAKEIPAKYKDEKWATLGVNVVIAGIPEALELQARGYGFRPSRQKAVTAAA